MTFRFDPNSMVVTAFYSYPTCIVDRIAEYNENLFDKRHSDNHIKEFFEDCILVIESCAPYGSMLASLHDLRALDAAGVLNGWAGTVEMDLEIEVNLPAFDNFAHFQAYIADGATEGLLNGDVEPVPEPTQPKLKKEKVISPASKIN